jgi:hypothetical protein
LPTK